MYPGGCMRGEGDGNGTSPGTGPLDTVGASEPHTVGRAVLSAMAGDVMGRGWVTETSSSMIWKDTEVCQERRTKEDGWMQRYLGRVGRFHWN